MRSTLIVVAASVAVLLVVAGCEQQQQQVSAVVTESAADIPQNASPSGALTLSVEQLNLLDWSRASAGRPKVVDTRVVDGVAVEFDILFPGNGPRARSIDYASSGSGGHGVMVGLDVGEYKELALKFTLVSVNGAGTAALPHEVVVGALIGPTAGGQLSAYEPLVLAFDSGRRTGTAKTPLATEMVRQIGFHAHMANPEVWSPNGTLLTLRAEPVADAAVLDSTPVFEERTRRRSTPRKRTTETPNLGPGRLGAW